MSAYYGYPQRRPSIVGPMLLGFLMAVAAVGGWWLYAGRRGPVLDPAAEPRAVAARGSLAEDEKANIEIYKMAAPSVVHITIMAVRQDFFTMDVQRIPQGTGSGFVWDEDAHIVTNYHVIQGASAAKVTLSD